MPEVGLGGSYPDPANIPPGCRFHPRCPLAEPRCADKAPAAVTRHGRMVECLLESARDSGGDGVGPPARDTAGVMPGTITTTSGWVAVSRDRQAPAWLRPRSARRQPEGAVQPWPYGEGWAACQSGRGVRRRWRDERGLASMTVYLPRVPSIRNAVAAILIQQPDPIAALLRTDPSQPGDRWRKGTRSSLSALLRGKSCRLAGRVGAVPPQQAGIHANGATAHATRI